MTKKVKGIICGIIGIAAITAIIPSDDSDKKIESIELSIRDHQIEYDINTKIPVDIVTSPTNAEAESFHFVSDSDSMGLYPDGIFTGDAEGTFDVYVMVDDVTSNTITINVVDISAREYAMLESEAQPDDAEQVPNQNNDEEQPSDDGLTDHGPTDSHDDDVPAEDVSTDTEQPSSNEPSDSDSENNTETVTPPSIDEQPAEGNEGQQVPDVPPVQDTESPENVETPTPEVPAVQQNTESNQSVEEPTNANPPASSGDSNFNTYDNASQQQTDFTYVLNTNTMKIHHPTCSSVKKIAPHNYATSNSSLEELFAQGYTTCGNGLDN